MVEEFGHIATGRRHRKFILVYFPASITKPSLKTQQKLIKCLTLNHVSSRQPC